MIFEDTLRIVLDNVEGARTVMIVGRDGMIVATTGEVEESGSDTLAAAYADLARKIAAANRDTGLGPPREFVAGCAEATVVWRDVNGEYGLVALLRPDGSLGRARYELAKAGEKILPDL